jgi:hypothetical protein
MLVVPFHQRFEGQNISTLRLFNDSLFVLIHSQAGFY